MNKKIDFSRRNSMALSNGFVCVTACTLVLMATTYVAYDRWVEPLRDCADERECTIMSCEVRWVEGGRAEVALRLGLTRDGTRPFRTINTVQSYRLEGSGWQHDWPTCRQLAASVNGTVACWVGGGFASLHGDYTCNGYTMAVVGFVVLIALTAASLCGCCCVGCDIACEYDSRDGSITGAAAIPQSAIATPGAPAATIGPNPIASVEFERDAIVNRATVTGSNVEFGRDACGPIAREFV